MTWQLMLFWFVLCSVATYGIWLAEFRYDSEYDDWECKMMAFTLCVGGPLSLIMAMMLTHCEHGAEFF